MVSMRGLVWSGVGLLAVSLIGLLVLDQVAADFVSHRSAFTAASWAVTVLQFGGAGLLVGAAVLTVARMPVPSSAPDVDWYR